MARNKAEVAADPGKVVLNVDLAFRPEEVRTIAGAVPGEDTDARKVAAVAMGALEDLARGGILLNPALVSRMAVAFCEATGKEQFNDADIVENFEKGVGRQGGKLSIVITLDPAYEDLVQQVADMNGSTIQRVLEDCWHHAWASGWLYAAYPPMHGVLMTPSMHEDLKEILGSEFNDGTELAALVRKAVGADVLAEI